MIAPELVFGKVHHQVSLAIWHDSFQREGKLGLVVVERLNEWSQGGRTRFRGKRPHGGSLPRSASSGPCTAYRFSADAEFQISVNDRHAAVAGFSWPEPRAAFARLTPGYHIQLGESRTELQARLLQSSRPQPRWSEVTYTVHQVPGPGVTLGLCRQPHFSYFSEQHASFDCAISMIASSAFGSPYLS